MSLLQSIFPRQSKSSFISYVYKFGVGNLVKKYCPIFKLNFWPKLFEKILEPKLYCLFNNVIIYEQHGFQTQKSTCMNFSVFMTNLFTTVEKRGQVDIIHTDLSKEFELVNHVFLINKLSTFGMGDPVLSRVSSFLMGRTQQVKIFSNQNQKSLTKCHLCLFSLQMFPKVNISLSYCYCCLLLI